MTDIPARKFVFLGDAGVGKTSIINRANNGGWAETQPTTAPGCTKYQYEDKLTINFWDTAGQENFHSMTTMYVRNAMGAIIIFDLTSQRSFDNLQKWFDMCQDTNPPPEVFYMIGNKADLENDRKVVREQAEDFAEQHHAIYYEVSAVSGQGLTELFPSIAEFVLDKLGQTNSPVQTVALSKKKKKKGKCCN